MFSDDTAIKLDGLGKCFQIYESPRDRLKQFFLPVASKFGLASPRAYYKEFWALKEISFEIKKGSTIGVIGRNGSGKSTLLQIICGTLAPTQGTVSTHGRIAALLELGAGFNPEFTGRENVLLNAAILGYSKGEILERMSEIRDYSELDDFFDRPVKTYSSGMYSRLAFSIAINVDPEILIVDEALAVGDARFVAKCMRRIKDIKDEGATILFVSHDVSSIRTLCEEAIWLDNGRMQEKGNVFPVTGRYMEYMFRDLNSEDQIIREQLVSHADPDGVISSAPEFVTSLNLGDSSTPSVDQKDLAGGDESVRPVTHWGSHVGLVKSAYIADISGCKKDVFALRDPLRVVVDIELSYEIEREDLSIAFSIKDLKGVDLIVSSTHDFEKTPIPRTSKFTVAFEFENPLITGKYLLVVAVESRRYRDIHYFEYIEGAHYFGSLAPEGLYGIFQPVIQQKIQVV